MDSEKNRDSEILWVKFIGKGFDSKSVPMYELGEILISVQQIIFKAFSLKKKGPLRKKDRERLALQMVSRRKDSDGYGFAAFLDDPIVRDILISLIGESLKAIGKYVYKLIKDTFKKPKSSPALPVVDLNPENMFIASLYMQLHNIVKRINSIGGIVKIEISVPGSSPLVIDSETKKYVTKELKDFVFEGEDRVIEGSIISIQTKQNIVVAFVEEVGNVKIYLNPVDHSNIRYNAKKETAVTFKGRPLYQFGKENFIKFEAFKADSITFA